MKCEYCGKDGAGRFCSRDCWEAVEGFDAALKAERSVEFSGKHESALAEWVDGVRIGKRELPPLSRAALLALVNVDYRAPAIVIWASEGKTQKWIGKQIGLSGQRAGYIHAMALQVLQAQPDTQ